MTTLLAFDILDYGVYATVAAVATVIALILAIMSIFGMGGDDMDISGSDGDTDGGLFSLRSIVGFALGFGWGGVIGEAQGFGWTGSLGMALGVGLGMFIIIALIMKAIYNLKSDGTLQYESLVGMTAQVYLTIPTEGKTGGQVKVAHPSQLYYLPAVQHGDTVLQTGSMVRIIAVDTGTLTVEKI